MNSPSHSRVNVVVFGTSSLIEEKRGPDAESALLFDAPICDGMRISKCCQEEVEVGDAKL